MDSGNSSAEQECDSHAARSLITTHQQLHQPPPPPPSNHHNNQINNIYNPLFFSHHLLNLDPVVRPSKILPSVTATTSNPKKRSRASRRAPTTVLTTDTNNFRSMVQEFTGIPSPPPTSTLDLFGRPSAIMIRSNTNNFDNLTQLPSYLLPQPSFNSFNQLPLVNHKKIENYLNGFGALGQIQMHEVHTTLPDLMSTAATPTLTRSSRNDELMALEENWEGGHYTNGKESSGMKDDDHGFIEPWICSSD